MEDENKDVSKLNADSLLDGKDKRMTFDRPAASVTGPIQAPDPPHQEINNSFDDSTVPLDTVSPAKERDKPMEFDIPMASATGIGYSPQNEHRNQIYYLISLEPYQRSCRVKTSNNK